MERFDRDQKVAYSHHWVDDVYHKTVATRPHKDGDQYVATFTLDFEGCDERATREYAASRAIIGRQDKFRKLKTEAERMEFDTHINMAEEMAKERKSADPVGKAKKEVARMTDDQKKELMEELKAAMEASS